MKWLRALWCSLFRVGETVICYSDAIGSYTLFRCPVCEAQRHPRDPFRCRR